MLTLEDYKNFCFMKKNKIFLRVQFFSLCGKLGDKSGI